jgi:folylpolyglutamate synthase/dihydropteroate synthase
MDHLGEDVISITREKCGIIKPSTPVVVGSICKKLEEGNRCLRVVLDICTQNGCPVIVVSDEGHVEDNISLLSSYNVPDWRIIEVRSHQKGRALNVDLKVHGPEDIGPVEPKFELIDGVLGGTYTAPMTGRHQAYNLAISASLSLLVLPFALSHSRLQGGDRTALKNLIEGCLEEVTERYECSELKGIMRRGLSEVRVRGRAEIIEIDGKEIIIDGCHNQEAAWALSDTIRDIFPEKELHFLMAMMKDKHPEDIIEPFQSSISTLTITRLPTERSMSTVDLLNGSLKAGKDIPEIHIRERTDKAIEQWVDGLSENSLGVATGTFYLYKHIRGFIKDQKVKSNHPIPP